MGRIKRGKSHLKHRKNILRKTKGYMWGRKSKIKLAKVAILKAGRYAYRDRKVKKRAFRGLWLVNLNAVLHEKGLSYSKFIGALKKKNIELDRKILAELAEKAPAVFDKIVAMVK